MKKNFFRYSNAQIALRINFFAKKNAKHLEVRKKIATFAPANQKWCP